MDTAPTGVRALAHDARWQAVELLGSLGEATATDLAGRVGLSPSAMSYHLRALAKAGFVERVQQSDDQDARERPWRLTFDDLVFSREDGVRVDKQSVLQFVDLLAASARRRVEAALRASERPPILVTQSDLCLTDDEREAMSQELTEVIEKYAEMAKGRPAGRGASAYVVVTPFSALE